MEIITVMIGQSLVFILENNMNVFMKYNNKQVTLPQNCVSGGEGDVYIKDNYAYKIYHAKNKAISEAKFNELKALEKDNIIKPEDLLLDNKGTIIGYAMKAIPKCYSLSRLVTNDFRNQHNIDEQTILSIVQQMRETFEYIHSKNCLVVDGNEMNYLISEDFKNVYFIDVDSYQTKTSPANAYSVSTLDPAIAKTNKFSQASDWFIFGVVSCTLLLGIHPFKGAYKGLSLNIKKGDVKTRMEKMRSIFNKAVSVNSAVRNFNIVPTHYREWFTKIFESTDRSLPPLNIFDVKTELNKAIKNVIFNETVKSYNLIEYKNNITDFILTNNFSLLKSNNEFYDIKNKNTFKVKNANSYFIEINNKGYLVKLENEIVLFDIETSNIIKTGVVADTIVVINNRLYSLFNNKINELKYSLSKLLINNSWDIILQNAELFSNIFVQKIARRNVLYIPFDNNACSIINMKELEDKKIVNAFYANKMIEIVYFEKGTYFRMIAKLSNNLNNYEIIFKEETETMNINAITLDNGVFISLFNDKELLLTSNNIDKKSINIVKDNNLEIDHKLVSYKNDVYMLIDNKINKISLK